MTGAPVVRTWDGAVVGVVSGRYNSADGWMSDRIWLARAEDVAAMLEGIEDVVMHDVPAAVAPADLTFSVDFDSVHLFGAGVDVQAVHGGVRLDLSGAVAALRRARARAGSARDRAIPELGDAASSMHRIGQLLTESFLPDPVRRELARVMRRAEAASIPVRFGICLTSEAVAAGLGRLPWEALPDPVSANPLALHRLVTVYRKTSAAAARRLPGPLRILVAISSPDAGGGAVLDYERELRSVLAAVKGARAGDAQVRVVPFATTTAVRAALDSGSVHILHLSAHGAPGVLVLEDEDGNARRVDAATFLREAVPPDGMPPVICLAACYTNVPGTPDADQTEAVSFAADLVAHGAVAVVGTETSVTDRYATRVFAQVYTELAHAHAPDVVAAVGQARRRVQGQLATAADPRDRAVAGLQEWATVTALSGAPDAVVLDPEAPRWVAWGAGERGARQIRGLLARDPGVFVGRRAEQRRLPRLLLDDDTAGVVLYGIGGVGKTTLAAEVVRRVLESAPHLAVATITGATNVDAVFAAIADALQGRMPLADGRDQALTQLRRVDLPWQARARILSNEVLNAIPLLLVLDNFEDNLSQSAATHSVPVGGNGRVLSDGSLAGLLSAFVGAPARGRLLLTCRYPFALPGGAGRRLKWRSVGPLTYAETMKLAWSLPHLDDLEDDDLRTIWLTVGGHPRTLEYVDALLDHGRARLRDITDRLRAQANHALAGQGINEVGWFAKDRDLDAAVADALTLAADDVLLDQLLATLSPEAVRLLIGVSVFREPVDAKAILFAVGGAEDDTPELRPPHVTGLNVNAALARLTTSSLLSHDIGTGTVFVHRWTASEMHRRWAGDPEKSKALVSAHLAAAGYWQWRGTASRQGRAAVVHDLMEARHHLHTAGDDSGASRLTKDVCGRLHPAGAWDLETALALETRGWLGRDHPDDVWYVYQLGRVAEDRGDYATAANHYHHVLTVSQKHGDERFVAEIACQLGNVAREQGDYGAAEQWQRQSLAIRERIGDDLGIASCLHNLAILAETRGDFAAAEEQYRRCLAILERLGEQAAVARTCYSLGMLAHQQGVFAMAQEQYNRALTIRERLEDLPGRADSYYQLGMLAQDREEYATAEEQYDRALTIRERLGDQIGMARAYHELGMLAHRRGDYTAAEEQYRRSLAIKQRLGSRAAIANTTSMLGILRSAQNRPQEAVGLHVQALVTRRQLQVPQVRVDIQELARLRAALGGGSFSHIVGTLLGRQDAADLMQLLDQADPES
jgi:tetratricopeptide (TPR) repeat protein